ncbi:MAG: ribonuclease R [Clostridia bacterium]|jgi:ribonuclease R|nr:ribonuclease R [Clostridia bacterium]
MNLEERVLEIINHKDYSPMKFKELSIVLGVKEQKDRDKLSLCMDKLITRGKVIKTKRGKYDKVNTVNTFEGKFIGHAKGFGFVVVEGRDEDIFVPKEYINTAMNEDTVIVKITKEASGDKRCEGEITKVLERAINQVVGTFQESERFGFVIADSKKISQDIFIPNKFKKAAMTGHKVVVEILKWPEGNKSPEGRIVEILGHKDDPGVDIMSIIREYDLPIEFPNYVFAEIEDLDDEVAEGEKYGRMDLRNTKMVTIDGADAKDLDDAVSLEILDNGMYKLGVHIADVTHYVKEKTELGKEALRRATSVYLVDRVIPMLPRKLSNGLCSLNANTDRLALSCIMTINSKGEVIDHEIAETLIHVDERMTYVDVDKILKGDEALSDRYKDFVDMFKKMKELSDVIRANRGVRGALDFDLPESKVILDENGKPIEIKAYDRNDATKIIEDFMLIANETVAEDFFWQGVPFVYRSHDVPDSEKLGNLRAFIKSFGYTIKGAEVHPKELQRVLKEAEGKEEELIIRRLMLRAMKQAKYTETNDEHYGLAAEYYCHFTSPIRRYPDLQIHRIIKDVLNGRMNKKRMEALAEITPKVADESSKKERRAEEAERDTIKLKKAEYMLDKIGNVYEGTISGLTNWGMYVELENTVEGLVRVTEMTDDFYVYNEDSHTYIGERTKNVYKLGQKIKVKVLRVNLLEKTIDFDLEEDE